VEEAEVIVKEYYKMIELLPFDEEVVQEAIAFHQVGKQANRIKCATIGFKAIEACIKEHKHE
jgi:nitrogen fixation protein NifU and related proteins